MPRRRFSEGILFGELYASVFVVLATLALVLSGGRIFDSAHLSYLSYLVCCIVGGAVGGVVFVLVEPLRQWWLGGALMGFLIAFPVIVVFGIPMLWSQQTVAEILEIAAIPAAIAGPIMGVVLIDE